MSEVSNTKSLVIFQPSGRRGYISNGTSIKEASRQLGVDIEGICGEKATCGKCKIRLEAGFFEKYGIESRAAHLSSVKEAERSFLKASEERDGYRLACQACIHGDIVVFVPEESRASKQIVRKAATERAIDLKPAVKKYYVEMIPPSLDDPVGDWERLQAELREKFSLGELTIDYQVLQGLQKTVRNGNWKITASVWMDKEVVGVEPGLVDRGYGLAVDIGTTTVVGFLCDLTCGEILATDSMMNPQVIYGEDVMSRLTYAMTNENK
jgi:uncharacterized 2Fe-2S/4Fe-4S cluster protein (DUF4445 family)